MGTPIYGVGEKAYFKWLLKRRQRSPFSYPLDFIKTIWTKAMTLGSLGGSTTICIVTHSKPGSGLKRRTNGPNRGASKDWTYRLGLYPEWSGAEFRIQFRWTKPRANGYGDSIEQVRRRSSLFWATNPRHSLIAEWDSGDPKGIVFKGNRHLKSTYRQIDIDFTEKGQRSMSPWMAHGCGFRFSEGPPQR